MTKPKVISTFTFVAAMFDHACKSTGPNPEDYQFLYAPTGGNFEYWVYAWNYRKQNFVPVAQTDWYDAHTIAKKLNEEIRMRFENTGVYPRYLHKLTAKIQNEQRKKY